MSSLREALEKALESLPVVIYGSGHRVHALLRPELLYILAAHPAEPAPVANRERVAEVLAAHRLVMSNQFDETECLCGAVFTPGFEFDEHAAHARDALFVAGAIGGAA